jgi:hypothetical protein
MSIDHTERSADAPGALEHSSPRSSPRKRKQHETEFRFFVDRHGRQHFNFRQTLWLDAAVDMAFTRVYSTALKTLAANLLAQALDKPARRAAQLAPAFSRECLMGAPDKAWALPKSTIEAWFASKQRRTERTQQLGRARIARKGAKVVRRK